MDPTLDRVRILVLGDAGAGKTTAIYALSNNSPISKATRTVGSATFVKIYEHKASSRTIFIEFLEVAGSAKESPARHVLCQQAHGVILIHDLSNRKSYSNLWRWLTEAADSAGASIGRESGSIANLVPSSVTINLFESNGSNQNAIVPTMHLPVLLLGTKLDLTFSSRLVLHRRYSIADECQADYVDICGLTGSFVADSLFNERFDAFMGRVIERRYRQNSSSATTVTSPASFIRPSDNADASRRKSRFISGSKQSTMTRNW